MQRPACTTHKRAIAGLLADTVVACALACTIPVIVVLNVVVPAGVRPFQLIADRLFPRKDGRRHV